MHKRKIRKYINRASEIFRLIGSIPALKPVLCIIIAISFLFILAPYTITKIIPGDEPETDLLPEADYNAEKIPDTIYVYRTESQTTETVGFEEYVKGVVSCEMPSSFHLEALKAQAVAARTYSLARVISTEEKGNPEAHPDAPLCDSTHCQVYNNMSQLEQQKGDEWMNTGWIKICKAVDSTKGQLLYYNGKLVEQALFHSSSGGRTENCEDVFSAAVPYLVSVESPYEDKATHQSEENSFKISDFAEIIRTEYPGISFGDINAGNIKIISRSSGGRVEKMQIGNGIIEGRNVREALNLPSTNFTIDTSADLITFTSDGSGHGVGMSQYGADGMAEKGYSYKEILSHYYKGTAVY